MSLVVQDAPLFKMKDFAYIKRKIDDADDLQKTDQNKNTIAARIRRYFEDN